MTELVKPVITYLFQRNLLLTLYILVFFLLLFGVYHDSGLTFFPLLFFYFISFLAFYFLLDFFVARKIPIPHLEFMTGTTKPIFWFLLAFTFSVTGYHLLSMEINPIIECWYATDILKTALIRQEIFDEMSTLLGYLSSFIIRAIIPFMLLYLYATKKFVLFFIFLIYSVFYCMSLIQKSYVLLSFIPLLGYLFFTKRIIQFILFASIPVMAIYFLIYLTNPELRPAKTNHPKKELTTEQRFKAEQLQVTINSSNSGLYNRLFIVPGKVVSEWFSLIPSKFPFLHGHGYHFLVPFGVSYVDYSRALYDELFPEYASKGFKGTVNVASFMYDYSNFGKFGLLISALSIVIVFITIQKIFNDSAVFLLILNALPVLLLSSSSLTNILFSGGWGLTIVLFLVFRKDLIKTI